MNPDKIPSQVLVVHRIAMNLNLLAGKNCLQSLINSEFVLLQVLLKSTLEILFSGALVFQTLLNLLFRKFIGTQINMTGVQNGFPDFNS